MAIFRFFKLAAATVFFQNVEILKVGRVRGSKCVIVPNFAVTGQTAAEIWRFFDFAHLASKMVAK